MTVANAISLLGGLAFFLFGMVLLGQGLEKVAGGKLEMILGKLTSTTLKGVLLGTLVTAVIQSSSATTVMVVGFVNSGIMKLANAIGIIMGANIGTTATGWLLVLAGVDGGGISSATIFAFVAFVGIILFFFCKKPTTKNVGLILLSFSVLMSGMQTMSGAMAPLKESPAFLNFITAVSHPLIAIAVGIVVTAIIQSCSASIGILQALSVTGVISYELAIPMVLGMCIGACVPVLISAIGANVNGKRAAFVYLYFNIAGSILLMIPFYILHVLIGFELMSLTATSMGIAIVNTVYKVAATILLIPFSRLLEKVAVSTIKDKHAVEDKIPEDNLLDERFLNHPALALEQVGATMQNMSQTAFGNLFASVGLLQTFEQTEFDQIARREEQVDRYEDCIGAYLVQLNIKELSEKETQQSGKYLSVLSNLERISDHAMNLAELAQELSSKQVSFSTQAVKELHICKDAVLKIAQFTQAAMEETDLEAARMVEPMEEVIDALTKELKSRHIQRLQSGHCTPMLGFIYNDYMNNFERVADHCSNIAAAVLETASDVQLQAHNYLRTLKQEQQGQYAQQLEIFANQYLGRLANVEVIPVSE